MCPGHENFPRAALSHSHTHTPTQARCLTHRQVSHLAQSANYPLQQHNQPIARAGDRLVMLFALNPKTGRDAALSSAVACSKQLIGWQGRQASLCANKNAAVKNSWRRHFAAWPKLAKARKSILRLTFPWLICVCPVFSACSNSHSNGEI